MPGYNPSTGVGGKPGVGSATVASYSPPVSPPPVINLVGPDGGLNYYANNGFAAAASAGLDTTFIPIGPFNTNIGNVGNVSNTGTGSIALYQAVGWNTLFLWDGNTTLWSNMKADGIYSWGGQEGNVAQIGNYLQDEPQGFLSGTYPGWLPMQTIANANQDGIPGSLTFTVNNLDFAPFIPAGTGQPAARTDTGCSTISGSPSVTDPSVTVADIGKNIADTSGTAHIPANTFILAVSGTTITMGSKALSPYGTPVITTVNANSNGTGISLKIGTLTTPGEYCAYPIQTPNGTYRHVDSYCIDCYWMSSPGYTYVSAYEDILGVSGMTNDQLQRGTNYGFVVDAVRANMGSVYPGPIAAFIEDGNALAGYGPTANITPPQYNWAVWASLIHGARVIGVFDHFGIGSGANTDLNLNYTFYQSIQPGQSISMYNQSAATHALVQSLAPVLNNYTATNFATVVGTGGTATGPGVPWPTCSGNATDLFNGIDILVKYYNATYYIFACTRNSGTGGPYSVTFNLPNGPSSRTVTVVNESRTLTLSGDQFTDTFANGATVHIYSIPQ